MALMSGATTIACPLCVLQVVLYGAHFKPSVFLAATLQAGQAKVSFHC